MLAFCGFDFRRHCCLLQTRRRRRRSSGRISWRKCRGKRGVWKSEARRVACVSKQNIGAVGGRRGNNIRVPKEGRDVRHCWGVSPVLASVAWSVLCARNTGKVLREWMKKKKKELTTLRSRLFGDVWPGLVVVHIAKVQVEKGKWGGKLEKTQS